MKPLGERILVSFKGKGHCCQQKVKFLEEAKEEKSRLEPPSGRNEMLVWCHPRLTDGNLKETHEQLVGKFDAGDTSTCFEFGVCVGQTRYEWRLFIA